jgi:hypothetical protein
MYEKVDERLVPTEVNAAMAAIAIRAAIRPYSIAVTPASSWISFVKHMRIDFSLRFKPAHAEGKQIEKTLSHKNWQDSLLTDQAFMPLRIILVSAVVSATLVIVCPEAFWRHSL